MLAWLGILDIGNSSPFPAVSTTDLLNLSGSGGSYAPAFSADGRFVVFVSHARNLVTNDDLAPYLNVFLRDVGASNTILVSVNTTGAGGGNADANSPAISSDGQFIAFASMASNLVSNDTNRASDIFLRDLRSGVTTLVSVDATGTSSAGILNSWTRHRLCSNPLISADGRWVVFESLATNLVTLSDGNQATDIFARDLQSNTTKLVSVNAAGDGSGNASSESPSITSDGRFIAFVSVATDLTPGVTNRSGDIYVRDMQSGLTTWVWANTNAASILLAAEGYRCFNPVISADGHSVVFKALTPGDPAAVYLIRHNLQSGVSTVLTRNSSLGSLPQLSADGRFVASEASGDVYVWDLVGSSNLLVSVNVSGTGGGSQPSIAAAMTPDGRNVLFLSAATNLISTATNGISQLFIRDLANGTTRLVTVGLDGLATSSDAEVTSPAISVDGRQIAFESTSPKLVADDLNQASDIFLRDLDSGTTQLLSQRHASRRAMTAAAASRAFPGSISADGTRAVFSSGDSNLARNDDDEFPDVFVRDLAGGTVLRANLSKTNLFGGYLLKSDMAISASGRYVAIGTSNSALFAFSAHGSIVRWDLSSGSNELVSVRFDGTGPVDDISERPAISSDGNLVSFHSAASDLVNPGNLGHANVFVRDMMLRTTRLISANRSGTNSGNADSVGAIFSPDDRWVLFTSAATDLTTNDTGGATNLFARDLLTDTTRIISVAPDGSSPVGYSRGATFSADSLHVAFVSTNSSVALYDFSSQKSAIVCDGCDSPSISFDGRLVAYEIALSAGPSKDIVVKDLLTSATNLISVNRLGTSGGNGPSISPLLSWDGRFVVFASKAGDLVENDTNGVSDIFVRDRLLGKTVLVSLNQQGSGSGNGLSSHPLLAANGRTVLFQSFASDLVAGDYNQTRDVFVLRLGGADTDMDGMDDDWEMAYFGTLDRDGTADFDGDGQTDRQEFLAGTDPTNKGSILRVLTLNLLGGGGTRVIWSAAPGKTYQVQFKETLPDSPWNDVGGPVLANGTTASLMDYSAANASHRFYRAVLVR